VPTGEWEPYCAELRGSLTLQAEQSSGLDLILTVQLAGARYDVASFLSDPATYGAVQTAEGNGPPQDVVPGATDKAWMRTGYSYRMAGAGPVGIASCGVTWSFSSERPELVAGPGILNVFDNPVSTVYTEVYTSEWMPFFSLEALTAMYDAYQADGNLRFTVVLQSVGTDPSQEVPVEDTVLAPVLGVTSGVVTANAFPNGAANKSQLCRVVVKADNNGGATQARGRIWFAASAKYK
jgi:hypothetical protein